MIDIKRQNRGKSPTKWGILLKGLPPRYKKILSNNLIFKRYSDDDRFILSIFKMEDANIKVSYLKRPFINPESKEVSVISLREPCIASCTCAVCKKAPVNSRDDAMTSAVSAPNPSPFIRLIH